MREMLMFLMFLSQFHLNTALDLMLKLTVIISLLQGI